jgi:oligopeptide/dipeptide ABC transporter ATP-binding protein
VTVLLEIDRLAVRIATDGGEVRAAEDVSLTVREGQRVGIIGESGSGKSVTAMSVLRLHDERRVRYGAGSRIVFAGEDLLRVSQRRLRALRGREISMVFQDPMASLNPVFTIGDQLGDVARTRLRIPKGEVHDVLVQALEAVEIHAPAEQLRRYPHQLSGGMRQRVLIAMALLCEPRLVIADEPTSALDVTVQASVLATLRRLAGERGAAVLLITHDMGVVARFCDVVHVMYGGRIVESGPVGELFARPRHPYTAALLRCTPRIDRNRSEPLDPIPGTQDVRRGDDPAPGCPFAPRCPHVADTCRAVMPPSAPVGVPDHTVACHRAAELDLRQETGTRDTNVDLTA